MVPLFNGSMDTIDYDGVSTYFMIIFMIELGIWVIQTVSEYPRLGDRQFQIFLGQIFTPASPSPPCSNMSLGGFGHHNTTVLKWVPGFGDLGPLFKF